MLKTSMCFFTLEQACCYASIPKTRGEKHLHLLTLVVGNNISLLKYQRGNTLKQKKKLLSKGIQIVDKVIWQSGEESFYFNDPEGNVLEVVPDEGIWD